MRKYKIITRFSARRVRTTKRGIQMLLRANEGEQSRKRDERKFFSLEETYVLCVIYIVASSRVTLRANRIEE